MSLMHNDLLTLADVKDTQSASSFEDTVWTIDMASPQSQALKHWAQIIKRWPVDKVRPESVAFQKLMRQRLNRSSTSNPAAFAKDTKDNVQPRVWNEAKELGEANALYNLLENRFANQYPMPQALRHPASNPSHYDDIVREMEEAPSRSWFASMMNRIRGSLRLS